MRSAFLSTRLLICLSLVACNGCGQGHDPARVNNQRESMESLRKQGAEAFNRGDYSGAAGAWREIASHADADHDRGIKIDALVNLGSCYEMLGQYDLAKDAFLNAADEAERSKDARRTALALSNLAVAYTLKPHNPPGATVDTGHHHGSAGAKGNGLAASHEPLKLFTTALALLAKEPSHDVSLKRLEASIHDNLGNYYADTGKFDAADAEYRLSIRLAEDLKNDPMLMKDHANAANAGVAAFRAYNRAAQIAEAANDQDTRDTAVGFHVQATESLNLAQRDNASALSCAASVAPTATKASLLVQLGCNFEEFPSDPEHVNKAQACFELAKSAAESGGDLRSRSYAYGYLAHIEELHQHHDRALALNREAVFTAQKASSPDALYLWQWQQGRIRKAMGDRVAALASYRQAVETVRAIRNDIALANGNVRSRFSFRDDVAALYFELADLLLADGFALGEKDSRRTEKLTLARDTLESLKSAELEDYLRDDCVQLYKARSQAGAVGRRIPDGAAIVYIVPLPDRIELLIQVGSEIFQARSATSRKELEKTAIDFRRKVTNPASSEYKTPAGQLNEWLIKPVEATLAAHGIQSVDTLVFVPDGLLRTVPMCALYDASNNRHLIERYAVATIPGLDLTEPSAAEPAGGQTLLLSGLSQQVSAEFNELPYVPIEMAQIQQLYGNRSRELLNSSFILSNMNTEVRNRRYNVVHIASHGKFGGDANNTFILTFNGTMNLNDLERLIRPQQFDPTGKPRPVDLLVLSCCQTAAGDDRAALGLGGIAVKSGARSALATLWPVSDEASTILIPDFYRSLLGAEGKATVSKAKALQHAQLKLLSDPHVIFRHPSIWAPYMIIGNWQ